MIRTLLILLLSLLLLSPANALELRYAERGSLVSSSQNQSDLADPDALPDGEVVQGKGRVRRAWLVFPTDRYDHAILGDSIEAAGVRVELSSKQQLTFTLPNDSVFEDRYPRLVDLDSDGVDEIVLVRSYLDRGAALVVLKIVAGKLEIMAESDPIGLAHRWLNPVGSGDFDQDGMQELAAVVTPHIGGILTLYKIKGDRLVPVHRMSGFSNHRIGSRILGQSTVIDINGDGSPDMAVPAVGFHDLRFISIVNGALMELNRLSHSSPIATTLQVMDIDGDGDQDLSYGLTDGRWVELLLP